MTPPFTICALVGSLRTGSLNRALCHVAIEVGKDEGLDIRVWDHLREVPPYDQDIDQDGSRPHIVESLKTEIRNADGLLIATPEYNYSVPGVLKNAIDWASRPSATSPLKEKPAVIMGASTGMSGTMRAQHHLRQSFVFTHTLALLQPEVQIPRAQERFDAQGHLSDESTRDLIRRQMHAFAEWIQRVGATPVGTG